MAVRQISVLTENEPGTLQRITSALSEADVNIRAMSIADSQNFGIFRVIVDNTDAALQALEGGHFTVTVNPVVAVALEDRTGELTRVVSLLSQNGLNIEYLYAFTVPSPRRVYVALRTANPYAAEAILEEGNIPSLDEDALPYL